MGGREGKGRTPSKGTSPRNTGTLRSFGFTCPRNEGPECRWRIGPDEIERRTSLHGPTTTTALVTVPVKPPSLGDRDGQGPSVHSETTVSRPNHPDLTGPRWSRKGSLAPSEADPDQRRFTTNETVFVLFPFDQVRDRTSLINFLDTLTTTPGPETYTVSTIQPRNPRDRVPWEGSE